jgi:aspartyl-tRNA(Asn)/glutamyl-tRNA(Gln) amidotransferase subunit C
VAVSESDVLHVAALARLAVEPARLPALVRELNGILEHMEVLGAVETGRQLTEGGRQAAATPMRPDEGGTSVPLALPREAFAPAMRDGFFLVPRLATHEDQGDRAP